MFETGTTITHATAAATRDAGLARIAAGDAAVDCSKLTHFDSSALAVLLSWQRAASERGVALSVRQLPTKLDNLARAYGIDSLLDLLVSTDASVDFNAGPAVAGTGAATVVPSNSTSSATLTERH